MWTASQSTDQSCGLLTDLCKASLHFATEHSPAVLGCGQQVGHLIKSIVLGISAMQTQAGLEEVRPQGVGKVGWGRGEELAYEAKPAGAMCPCQGSPGVHLMSASTLIIQ